MLLRGEKELAEKLLYLVKNARRQEATVPEQGKVLHQMGELYLKDAIETGNGEQFVKASALINAALVRIENKGEQKMLKELLYKIYQDFFERSQKTSFTCSMEQLEKMTTNNHENLKILREDIHGMCGNDTHIEFFFNLYIVCRDESLKQKVRTNTIEFAEENMSEREKRRITNLLARSVDQRGKQRTHMEELIVEEIENLSSKVKSRMIHFVERLWQQALEMCSISPPCQYAVVGLGSLARQEITPYSDLEFALLIETDSKENKQYFKNLVYLFHLLILNLGETPIPSMAVESLNDFQSPSGDKFFDRITPNGFRLDGAMPWACKTPIGRKETPQKEALDLIKTPEDMAALQMEENSLGQAYHVADILCSSIFICGSSMVFDRYTELHAKAMSEIDNEKRAKTTLVDDYNRSPDLTWWCYNTFVLKNKTNFYRFSSTFVENLRMFFAPSYKTNSVWKVVDHLATLNVLSSKGAFNLKVQLAICYGFRILTYFKNHGQYESFMFVPKQENQNKEGTQNMMTSRAGCYVAYFTNSEPLQRLFAGTVGMKNVIEDFFIERSISDLKKENFISFNTELVPSPFPWFRFSTIVANLKWARSSKELPHKSCGTACLEQSLNEYTYIQQEQYDIMLLAIDELLATKGCQCLPLIKTSLLVTKAILILDYNAVGQVPKEADVLNLLEMYKENRYNNVRERFCLLIDIGDLAKLITDKNIQLSVIEDTIAFLGEIKTFEVYEQTLVNLNKYLLLQTVIKLCGAAGKPQKGVLLCERQIDEYERELGYINYSERLGIFYGLLGNLKGQCGLPKEQLYYYQKAFDIYLFICMNGSKDQMFWLRRVAFTFAEVHKDLGNVEAAIDVLMKSFTEDGKGFHIETDLDIKAMLLLYHFGLECAKFKSKANQFLKDAFEASLARAQSNQLKSDTLMEIVNTMIASNAHHQQESAEIVFRKLSHGNASRGIFCIEILNQLLSNEAFNKPFLDQAHLELSSQKQYPQEGMAAYKPAEHFCEKVVKECATNKIHQMCLIFIEFKRIRLQMFHALLTRDRLQVAKDYTSSQALHVKLLQFFPNCQNALVVTSTGTLETLLKHFGVDPRNIYRI